VYCIEIEKEEMADCSCNPYSLLPTELVIQLVGNLNNLRTVLFSQITKIGTATNPSLCTVWRIEDNHVDYLISVSPYAGPPPYTNVTNADINFYSINYALDGTFIQTIVLDNVTSEPISVVRSLVNLTYRSINYNVNFSLYQFGDPSEQKQNLLHLFTFPSFTFVLYGNIVMTFTLIDYFPIITYIGKLNHTKAIVESYFQYDNANGTTLAIINSQLVFYWNDKQFALTNFYPDINDTIYSSKAQPANLSCYIFIGGQNVFSSIKRIRNPVDPNDFNIIRKATAGFLDQYTGDEAEGGKFAYTSLRTFVKINEVGPFDIKYLIAFTETKTANVFPKYAVIGVTNFRDSQVKLRTYPLPITFTDTKDPSFQNYKQLFFKYSPTGITIYAPGFDTFLFFEAGSITLNDVTMTLLSADTERSAYSPAENKSHKFIAPTPVKNTFEHRFNKPKDF